MPIISAKNICYSIGNHNILDNISAQVERDEIVTIIGPNGGGKTTLLRILLGIIKPSSGTISKHENLRIGYVPQKLEIQSRMPISVSRFIKCNNSGDEKEIIEYMKLVGIDHKYNDQLSNVSPGQLQRILLAKALTGKPNLLALDEPTASLDQSATATFYNIINRVSSEFNCAVILISHNINVVLGSSNRIICINGHICCEGEPSKIADQQEYRDLFGIGTKGTMALYKHSHNHEHEKI